MVNQEEFEAMKKEFALLPKEEKEKILQNMNQCIFCLISSGKIPSKKIYEDEEFIAILDIYPASKGHVVLIPKKHITKISEIPERAFNISKIIISSIKNISKDINLFIAEGKLAGQKSEHIVIHLIPRYENDNIPLTWNPSKANEEELDELQKQITSNIIKEEPKKKVKQEKKETEEDIIKVMPEYEEGF